MNPLFASLLAFLISLSTTRLMIAFGFKDVPNQRSSHTTPTPKGGGIGIILGLYGALWMMNPPAFFFFEGESLWISLLIGAAISASIAFVDDLKPLNPWVRLFLQISISVWFLSLGTSCEKLWLPHFGEISLGKVGFILSLLWLVGFMNAYNFMDGLHGMLAMTTLVSTAFLGLVFLFHLNFLFASSLFLLFGATSGFAWYNIPQARIFIGDVGSQFLGFLLGGLSLLASHKEFGYLSFWSFPLLFFIFLYDPIFTVIRKGLKRQNVLIPHREFLFHLLNRAGWTHLQVSFLYGVFALFQGLTVLLMQYTSPTKHPFFYIPFLIGAFFYTKWVFKKAKVKGIQL